MPTKKLSFDINDPNLVTRAFLAAYYRVHPDTIRRWQKVPGFPKTKRVGLARRPRYDFKAVREFVHQDERIEVK